MNNLTLGIPAYNEGKTIKRCLNLLLPQLNESDEVIVIASACTDNTASEVRSLNDERIRLIEDPKKRGKTAAINQIMNEAIYNNIVFCDADVLPAEDSVSNLLKS